MSLGQASPLPRSTETLQFRQTARTPAWHTEDSSDSGTQTGPSGTLPRVTTVRLPGNRLPPGHHSGSCPLRAHPGASSALVATPIAFRIPCTLSYRAPTNSSQGGRRRQRCTVSKGPKLSVRYSTLSEQLWSKSTLGATLERNPPARAPGPIWPPEPPGPAILGSGWMGRPGCRAHGHRPGRAKGPHFPKSPAPPVSHVRPACTLGPPSQQALRSPPHGGLSRVPAAGLLTLSHSASHSESFSGQESAQVSTFGKRGLTRACLIVGLCHHPEATTPGTPE